MMKTATAGAAAGLAIMAAVAGTVWAGRSGAMRTGGEGMAASGKGGGSPVVVELFTSEGCSSCPPADAVLAQLEKQNGGTPIIALGLHVDYWNRLGWADPFSSKQFSDRQNEYAQAFKTDSVYTPQMVVDGQAEFVGSDEVRASSAIAEAARRPKAAVSLVVEGATVRATVDVLPSGVKSGEVFAALTESGLSSQVARGENAGRHLAHASVVRKLILLGTVGPKGGMVAKSVGVPTGVRKENGRMVVFVQDTATHRIVGAAQTTL